MYCDSFASLHSHKPASPSCSGSSFQAPSCERVANSFDCLCTNRSDHVVLDRSSWKLPRWWASLSRPHACFLTSSLWSQHAKAHHVLSQESAVTESQAPHKVSGQRLPVKGPLSSSTLLWLRDRGVYVRDSLLCPAWDFSRIVAAAEQLRSLPEGLCSFVDL